LRNDFLMPPHLLIRPVYLVLILSGLSIALSNARWQERCVAATSVAATSVAATSAIARNSTIAEQLPTLVTPLFADAIAPDEAQIFQQIMGRAIAANLAQRPLSEIMPAIAAQFLGAPYVAGLLDQTTQEQLVVTLQEFDCVLFVETVLALSRTVGADYIYSDRRNSQSLQPVVAGRYCGDRHCGSRLGRDSYRIDRSN
jgi:hypothetical protein